MIYCVWYPSGGFGHFINAVLTLHGDNFIRPVNNLTFSTTGNSHNLDLVVPKYFQENWPGGVEFCNDKNYCVLVDNGIDHDSDKFKLTFPDSTVIRICYSDFSWPIIARTLFNKAMETSIEKQLRTTEWNTDAPWAQREKYFLFLRDHSFRNAWRQTDDNSLFIDEMLAYSTLHSKLNSIVPVKDFNTIWTAWRNANSKYIEPVETAQRIVSQLKKKECHDITNVKDVWTQSVVYYYIWIMFNVEVPHNDFSNFFSNTGEILELIS